MSPLKNLHSSPRRRGRVKVTSQAELAIESFRCPTLTSPLVSGTGLRPGCSRGAVSQDGLSAVPPSGRFVLLRRPPTLHLWGSSTLTSSVPRLPGPPSLFSQNSPQHPRLNAPKYTVHVPCKAAWPSHFTGRKTEVQGAEITCPVDEGAAGPQGSSSHWSDLKEMTSFRPPGAGGSKAMALGGGQ